MQSSSNTNQKWIEHIRKRAAMYIGDLGMTGFKQMIEYLFEEIPADSNSKPVFEVTLFDTNRIVIKITNIEVSNFIAKLEHLRNADDNILSFGLSTFIALSSQILIYVNETPAIVVFSKQAGVLESAASTSQEKEKYFLIDYTFDEEIFTTFKLIYEQINHVLQQFAFLNPGVKIVSQDKSSEEPQRNIFHYPTGIFKQLDFYISQLYYVRSPLRLEIEFATQKHSYQIGIAYVTSVLDKTLFTTYAGNIETFFGGSLEDGILDGIILSVKRIAEKENTEILITRKLAKENLIVIAAVKGEEFIFSGSTKHKLGMPKLRKEVAQLVSERMIHHFETNPQDVDYILKKFIRLTMN